MARISTSKPARDPIATRSAIVDAAANAFAADGYAGTSTARIAAAAGVAEGTLFHHFPNKRAVLAAVGDAEGERVLGVIMASLAPDAPPTALEDVFASLFAYARARPDAYRVFLMDGDVEELEGGFAHKRAAIVAGLSALLAQWSARGFVRRLDPDVVAELLFAAVDTAVRRLLLGDQWDQEARWRTELVQFTDALLGESP